jgi:serine/threonine protein kinase/tetratricopeptide (TPR) repeat protein
MSSSSEQPSDGAADQADRLRRLGDAMEVWLAWRTDPGGRSAADLMAQHPELQDLLATMLDAGAEGPDEPAPIAGDDSSLRPGRTFGDFRIVREVGRGGMGTVYEADQISLPRRVALKVLHGHLAVSPRSIARFRSEAAAASRLRHPGIVPIHEVGEWHGRHWFSMEFFAGRSLHELVHHERFGVRADCSRAAEVAELVARIADALHHAHEHGLVHRDVKPHNVMLGADGSVSLLDFGLAKYVDPEVQSVTGDFLGTPHYCSPEQIAGGEVGPRADVFALGIVLYELLARRRPFDGETTRQVLRRIEVGEYEPLAKAAPGTPRDLQTICHRALEVAPRDRYASAGEFGADLRRFLRIEPIAAASPGPWTRGTKWLRRHRLRVSAWSAATLLVVGSPIAWALHQRATTEVVERERRLLDAAERLAFRSFEQTLSMLAEQLDREPGPGSRRQPRVDEVVHLCEQFLGLRVPDAERALRVAQANHVLGGIHCQLGDPAAAARAIERGLQVLGDGSDPQRVELRARLLRRQLYVAQAVDPSDGAEQFAAAVAVWQDLATRPDADLTTIAEYAETLVLRARALADQPPRRIEAERLVRQALAVLTPARQEASPAAKRAALRAATVLGHCLLWTGRPADAATTLQEVVERIGAADRDAALRSEKALALAALGDAWLRLGRTADAEAQLRAAIDVSADLVAEFPGAHPLRRGLARARARLATQLLGQRKAAAAEDLLRDVVAMVARDADSWMERGLRADADVQLANCLLLRGNGVEASDEVRELLGAGVAAYTRLVDEQPGSTEFRCDLGGALNNLAALENEHGDAAVAAGLARRAIAQQRAVLELAPENRRARMFLGMHHAQLALALAESGAAAEVLATGTAAVENAPRHGPSLRQVAEAATQAVAHAGAADAEALAAFAVQTLGRLATVVPNEARRWLDDARFAALRDRDDYRRLLLEQTAK